ncbi:shikimate dehydrogenase [Luteolibacter yonseiensis]|uniref:Shikimate dehydrogenase (NADP(+)) n=1 Tax=Luteolibacter yonseiensis TaxID=1144680 RepID=A0A934R3C0_9BACT|nr:shikimate dehydrogenase [Luteolibacter yonseiensis]MBK1815308.1 shikimate dehydrogenase [Luteolibacter yonseiensis]
MKHVYTIDDLASRELLDAGAGKPAKLAVIGHPIAHSASPKMHQAALDAFGMDLRYIRLDIEPGQVGEAFSRMRALGFIGCNVTVPHKLEAMENCEVHPDAMALGAVNTIRFDQDATRGFNTDGPGFEQAVRNEFEVELSSLATAIFGAGGGAGQAIATQACLRGIARLLLVNRTAEKLGPLVERLRLISPRTEITAISFGDPQLAGHCLGSDLIVNTSSVGLKADDPSILPVNCLRKDHLVYDTIYQPAVTPLLALANAAGCRTTNGLSMLINQGALAFQHWFPGTEPLPHMTRALRAE